MEKADNIQELVDNVPKEMETLKNNEKEMLNIKTTIKEMKNAIDGLISTLDTAQERICKPEDKVIEISKSEMQREKRMNKTEHQKTM